MKRIVSIVIILMGFSIVTLGHCGVDENLSLFTEDELHNLGYLQSEWQKEIEKYRDFKNRYQKKSLGPIVSVKVPEAIEDIYRSHRPLQLLVHLKGGQAALNMDSLVVKGKRGFFTVDITHRIQPFLRKPFTNEDADYVIDAKIPLLRAGRYLLIMSIEDVRGNKESLSAFIEVVED